MAFMSTNQGYYATLPNMGNGLELPVQPILVHLYQHTVYQAHA